MNSLWLLQCKRENVVTSAGDSQNDIARLHLQEARIHTAVFPGKGVDVAILELAVLLQLVVVVDAPVVVLVPARWQWETCSKVHDGRLVGLAVELDTTVTAARRPSLKIKSRQEGRLGCGGIDLGKLGLRGAALLGAADPDVVRDTDTEEVVARVHVEDSAELVFKVVLGSSVYMRGRELMHYVPFSQAQG